MFIISHILGDEGFKIVYKMFHNDTALESSMLHNFLAGYKI